MTPSGDVLLIHRPAFLLGQSWRITGEKLRSFRIAFELPLEPCNRSHRPVAAMGLAECTAGADSLVGNEDRKLFDALEIIHAVGVRNVSLSAQKVKDRRVKFRKMLLRERRHAGQTASAPTSRASRCASTCAAPCATRGSPTLWDWCPRRCARGIEYPAVHDECGLHARVGRNFQCLQAAARMTENRNFRRVELPVIRALGIRVLRGSPIDGIE